MGIQASSCGHSGGCSGLLSTPNGIRGALRRSSEVVSAGSDCNVAHFGFDRAVLWCVRLGAEPALARSGYGVDECYCFLRRSSSFHLSFWSKVGFLRYHRVLVWSCYEQRAWLPVDLPGFGCIILLNALRSTCSVGGTARTAE